MLFEDSSLIDIADQELLMGASYGSNVTVSEIIVMASSGGGNSVEVNYDYYQQNVRPDRDEAAFEAWSDTFRQEVEVFGASHVTGDPNSPVYQQAREAMQALYALAKIMVADPHQVNTSYFPAPGGTLTWTELLQSVEHTRIDVGPHSLSFPAWTDVSGTDNIIHIDPVRLTDYTNAFGPVEGLNYVIYHELAHASIDGEAGALNPNREAITNEYGQILAGINGAVYPTDSELALVGGTVPRT